MRQDAFDYVARVRDAYDTELAQSSDRVRALGAAVGAVIAGSPRLDPVEALLQALALADLRQASPWPHLRVLTGSGHASPRPVPLHAVPRR